MVTDIFIKLITKVMELYSTWVPNWEFPDGLITALTYVITYSKYIGIWINTEAFYGSIQMVIETLLIIAILKGIGVFISTLRGSNSQI